MKVPRPPRSPKASGDDRKNANILNLCAGRRRVTEREVTAAPGDLCEGRERHAAVTVNGPALILVHKKRWQIN